MIMVVNASNTRVRNYKPFFDRLASWGFIVAGNEDPQAGTVFIGDSAEILNNPGWQDIEKNR